MIGGRVAHLAAEITAWMQMLALTDHQARRWEPKKLRYRIFTIPATLARTARPPALEPAPTPHDTGAPCHTHPPESLSSDAADDHSADLSHPMKDPG